MDRETLQFHFERVRRTLFAHKESFLLGHRRRNHSTNAAIGKSGMDRIGPEFDLSWLANMTRSIWMLEIIIVQDSKDAMNGTGSKYISTRYHFEIHTRNVFGIPHSLVGAVAPEGQMCTVCWLSSTVSNGDYQMRNVQRSTWWWCFNMKGIYYPKLTPTLPICQTHSICPSVNKYPKKQTQNTEHKI